MVPLRLGCKPVATRKREWAAFKAVRYRKSVLYDEMWDAEVMTQPTAIKVATDWARARDAVCFFDAGDVQANGFQVVEDDRLGRTFTETGASYMGFAVSALLATAVADEPFYGLAISGDGAFTMNPQVLIDGVEHGADRVHPAVGQPADGSDLGFAIGPSTGLIAGPGTAWLLTT